MPNFNFSYDKGNDDLFIYSSKSKSKGSVELGNLVFDYNSKKEVVGIEIMNASKVIRDLAGESIKSIKNLLNSLQECKLDIKTNNSLMTIRISLASKSLEISPVISVPSISETSPALAYA